ncbi:MAG TPA: TIGR03435 family protein [Bryobacteraceae bacterium]|nr:TIGR03435 family protein [Bryobacteraceae bacterium]
MWHRTVPLAALMAAMAAAQPAPPVKFEVASIKAAEPGREMALPHFDPGGNFSVSGMPLRFVIAAAWNVGFQSTRLVGGPDWVGSRASAYDIEAKAPEGAFPPGMASNVRTARMRQMLQALLEDRFHLKIRTERRDLPLYMVVVAKGGPKLEKSDIEEQNCPQLADSGKRCHQISGGRGRGLHGTAVSLADVLGYVENWTDRPLVDGTGLTGLFKIDTRGWRDMQPAQEPAPGTKAEDGQDAADVPTLFQLFDRLGLKLIPQKGEVSIYTIEQVERPTGN